MAKNYAELIQGINADIPDNDTGLVSPADVRQNMIDLADWAIELPSIENLKGVYNVSTNTPTLSATPDPTFKDGAYYDNTVSGAISFGGINFTSGTIVNIGDRLIKKGTQWYLVSYPQNTSKIATWIAQNYLSGSQVNYLGQDWIAISDVISTDIPSNSLLWKRRNSALSERKYANRKLFSPISQVDFGYTSIPNSASITYSSSIITTTGTGGKTNCAIVSQDELSTLDITQTSVGAWLCIGSTIQGDAIVVAYKTAGSVTAGNLYTINQNTGAISSVISTPFPSTPISNNRIKIVIEKENIKISSYNGTSWVVWGTATKTNLGVVYGQQFLGYLINISQSTVSVTVNNFVNMGLEKNTLDTTGIATATSIVNKQLLLSNPATEEGIEKIDVQTALDLNQTLKLKNPNSVAVGFSVYPNTTTISYVSNTITITSGSSQFYCALATPNIEIFTTNYANDWIVLGTNASGNPLIIAVKTGLFGQVKTVANASGYNVGATIYTASTTTAPPSNTNRIKVDASGNNILIYYSTDTGVNFTLWNSIAKSAIGQTDNKLGVLALSPATVYQTEVSSLDLVGVEVQIDSIEQSAIENPKIIVQDPNKKAKIGWQYLNQHKFVGKSGRLYGDSITTDGWEANLYYTPKLKSKLNLASCSNYGISGMTLAGELSYLTNINTAISTNPDLFVLLAGTNDFGTNKVIGSVSDLNNGTTTGTTAGGLAFIIKTIQTALPLCRIVVCTPTPRFYNNNISEMYTANTQGKILQDYRDIIIEVCKRYSIACCDLFSVSGINQYNYTNFLKDGLHPKEAGYGVITDIQSSFVKCL